MDSISKIKADNRDVMYYGKPEYNLAGQQKRRPRKVIKAYTDYSVLRSGCIATSSVIDLVLGYYDMHGKLPTELVVPGEAKGYRGFIDKRLGFISVNIVGDANAARSYCR